MAKADLRKKIIGTMLDQAAATAVNNATEGVSLVIAALNQSREAWEEQFIMDEATKRGFHCEYYPVNGQMGIRVRWEN